MKDFMKRAPIFWQETRHLWVLLVLVALGGTGFVLIRSWLIPASYGQLGPYRADAIETLASKPSVLQTDQTCLKCHVDVERERADSLHKAVGCASCHGVGRDHVAQALRAADSPDEVIAPAQQWDRNFLTHIDLYVTKDRAVCLVCHENKVGMPQDFKKIDVVEHLEEMGAQDPSSRETCFECHGGHNTAP
jgi:hypothetical protein